MSSKQTPQNDNSTIHPRGLSPLPDRPRRRAARVDYAALADTDISDDEHGPQRQPGSTRARKRGAPTAATAKPDEAGSSSDADDVYEDQDELEELSEDEQAAEAADGLLDLADAAQQATQGQQRGQPAKKAKFADARYVRIFD